MKKNYLWTLNTNIMKKVNHKNAVFYNWGNMCSGWHLLKKNELSIIEEEMPPGTSEIKHYHKISEQFFYILEGNAKFEMEDELIELNENEGIYVQPKSQHKIYNESDSLLKFLVISHPKSHGDKYTI
ncbi:MAG: cupin domain-containing protein [Ignavibacteriaceae bacterium]